MSQGKVRSREVKLPPGAPLVALAGWAVPGLGYILIGERWRGVVCGLTIVVLFVMGLVIGGVRVVDVPGYDPVGKKRNITTSSGSQWVLTARPLGALMEKPWYLPQLLVGLPNVVASYASVQISDEVQKARARLGEIGTLYAAVAGVMNLIVLIDSAQRSMRKREELVQKYPHLIG